MLTLNETFEKWQLLDASKSELVDLCIYLKGWGEGQRASMEEKAARDAFDEGYEEGRYEQEQRDKRLLEKIAPALAQQI